MKAKIYVLTLTFTFTFTNNYLPRASSFALRIAAIVAFSAKAFNPGCIAFNPASVVPPGLATAAQSSPGLIPSRTRIVAVPNMVRAASSTATLGETPARTAASASSSAHFAMKAGPDPLNAVTASICSSSTSSTCPPAEKIFLVASRSVFVAPGPPQIAVTPSFCRRAWFGIARTTRAFDPASFANFDVSTPAKIDISK